ncbi:MAG: helix-turn-helix domain-containing protein [Sedimentibacter sp.]
MCNYFSERILLLRKTNHLSQAMLGEAVGLSKQAINDIEKGRSKTTLDKAKLLANYFDVSLDYLTGRTDNPNLIGNSNEQNFTQEEVELLEDFRLLNNHEKNIIIGKISEMIYNKIVEENNNNLEVSEELLNAELIDRLNK